MITNDPIEALENISRAVGDFQLDYWTQLNQHLSDDEFYSALYEKIENFLNEIDFHSGSFLESYVIRK